MGIIFGSLVALSVSIWICLVLSTVIVLLYDLLGYSALDDTETEQFHSLRKICKFSFTKKIFKWFKHIKSHFYRSFAVFPSRTILSYQYIEYWYSENWLEFHDFCLVEVGWHSHPMITRNTIKSVFKIIISMIQEKERRSLTIILIY